MLPSWSAFQPDVRARFLERPNRFVVRAEVEGRIVEAHCPNPGRLGELLFPGTELILETAAAEHRKLAYTLVAVVRRESGGPVVIPMASARANAAFQALVLPILFPGATVVRPEYTLGRSRFDFLVEEGDRRHLVEVKACSEVEFGTALFPDAPSLRARKHLEELAQWGRAGYEPHVVGVVVHGRPRFWAPNVHTDPEFARTLARLAPDLHLHAVALETDEAGQTHLADPSVRVDLPDPGPDRGHLVRVEPREGRWVTEIDWYNDRLGAAVTKSPARRSFALRGPADRRHDLARELAPLDRGADPRTDPHFMRTLMKWRHEP